ncbi:MAG: hypothetical protein PHW74_03380 [Desulfobacca sp.]|nr:hypothetical protein [Desulfobacca sp.]
MTIEISYISDLAEILPDVLLVSNDYDYLRACQELALVADAQSVQRIWVRHKSHFLWLQHFTGQIGLTCNFSEKTPRLLLAAKWQVELPDWLDDATVRSQKLLRVEIVPGLAPGFVKAMLKHFLGPVWGTEALEADNLAAILVSLTRPEMKEPFRNYPILRRCVEEQAKMWAENTKHPWVQTICPRLAHDPENLWKELTLWGLTAGYPARLLDYLTTPDQGTFLRSVPCRAVSNLPLHPLAVDQAETQIEMFFADLGPQVTSSNDFAKVLARTSGRLSKEFQLIYDLLQTGQFAPADQDLKLIRQKFKACPGVSAAKLAGLNRFVRPARPTIPAPAESWEARRWLTWTEAEYIPFRHWQTQNKSYDQAVEGVVQDFTDWYIAEYAALHQEKELSLTYVLDQWQEAIKHEHLSVILIIDCLPLTFWSLLPETLAKIGLHRHDQTYRFAPLPSYTDSTKPLLVSGQWDGSGKSYEVRLQERSVNDWGGKKTFYLPNLKSLAELVLPTEPAVLLVNFLPTDEILHDEVEARISTYEEELSRLFHQIAEAVSDLWNRFPGNKKLLSLYVVTDHGACRILEEEKNSLEAKVVNKLFINEKYRVAQVLKSEKDTISPNLWELGYCFQKPFLPDDQVYFIPRGHHTVKLPNTSNGYVHGGATPEEVVVPGARFRAVKVPWRKPLFRFLNLKIEPTTGKAVFYIQRVVELQFEVQNPNQARINILRVDVISPDAEVKEFTTPTVAAQDYDNLLVTCYFNKPAAHAEELHLQISHEISGEEYVVEMKISAEFKSAVSGGFNLREL